MIHLRSWKTSVLVFLLLQEISLSTQDLHCYNCQDEKECQAGNAFKICGDDNQICWSRVKKTSESPGGVLVERGCTKGLNPSNTRIGCKRDSPDAYICYCEGHKCNREDHGLIIS